MKNLYKVHYQPTREEGTYKGRKYAPVIMDYTNTVIIEAKDVQEAKEKFHQGNCGEITGIEFHSEAS